MTSQKSRVPPNILVLTDDQNEFEKIKLFVQEILGKNSYTIYNLTSSDLHKSSLWVPSCRLLISSEQFNLSDQALDNKMKSFIGYMSNGGKILSLPALNDNLERDQKSIKRETFFYHKDKYLFELKYEKDLDLVKETWNNNLAPEEELFYAYLSNENEGVHFISKVI